MAARREGRDVDVLAEATAERRELADLLDTLTEADWDRPSLCAGWRVRDVVAHVVGYDGLGASDLVRLAVAGRFRPDRMNEARVRDLGRRDPSELVVMLRQHARPSGLTAGFGGAIGLVDTLIHHQDVRRPLGLPREVPDERIAFALRFAYAAPVVRGFWNVRGVRVGAPRVDWYAGRGPLAEGEPEAVLMTVAGRRGVASELTGPGVEVLTQRLG